MGALRKQKKRGLLGSSLVAFLILGMIEAAAQAYGEGVYVLDSKVVTPGTGPAEPVLFTNDNAPPEDCPPGTFWSLETTKDLVAGDVLTKCGSGETFQLSSAPSDASYPENALVLVPWLWPKPLVPEDTPPRSGQ